MSALPTPRLADLDDPLAPRRQPADPPAPESPRPGPPKPKRRKSTAVAAPAAPSLADEALVAVFARVPASIGDGLANALHAVNAGRARQRRVSQQHLLGAVLDRFVTSGEGLTPDELGELVDAYRRRLVS